MFTGLTFAENYGSSVDTGIGMPRASIIPPPVVQWNSETRLPRFACPSGDGERKNYSSAMDDSG